MQDWIHACIVYVTQPCQSCWKQARWLCFNQYLKVNKKVSTTANCIGDRSSSLFAGYIIWLCLSKVNHNTMVYHKHTLLTITLNKYTHIIQQHQTHAINIFQTYTNLGSPNHRLKRKVWKFAKTCSIVFFFRSRSAWHLTRSYIVYVYYIMSKYVPNVFQQGHRGQSSKFSGILGNYWYPPLNYCFPHLHYMIFYDMIYDIWIYIYIYDIW